jgi:uroporphyrinogen decarboxylase
VTTACDDAPVTRTDPSQSVFVRAARREPVPYTPVWFMRQAGRALPEYRAARAGTGMLEACLRPELVIELTMQPVRRYGVDAAVLFSDIMLPLVAAGVPVEIVAGTGPVVADPVRSQADAARLPVLDPDALAPVTRAVTELTGQLGGTPLIGFAGAPFTLASYLVEGGPSREHARTKAFMRAEPRAWHVLAERLAAMSVTFLRAQVRAGAAAVQLFDSWAGALSPRDYTRYALPYSRMVLEGVADLGVPRVHFGVGTGELLSLMASAGAEMVGVDWRVPLREAARRVGPAVALQGNLDPTVVLAGWPATAAEARAVLDEAVGLPGHVFNLGHGVLPDSDPQVLARLVALVHDETRREG